MHSIAILGFFSLVVVFFFTGRDDFGLKPAAKKNMKIETSTSNEEVNLN